MADMNVSPGITIRIRVTSDTDGLASKAWVEERIKDVVSPEETDPTVPEWAKQPEKPTYTADEVGADPAGSAQAAKEYADRQIAAIPTPDVSGQIGEHNQNPLAHPAIRQAMTELGARLNALADSDDTTLDQLSEIVAYIKSNKGLIDAITTSKVSVSDIVDSLTSEAADKPLSAKQGAALKQLIDAITIPKKVSELQNDAGYLTAVPGEYVTDAELESKGYITEHQDISGKLDASALPEAINTALAQAKASGEFDGADGAQGPEGPQGEQGPKGDKGDKGDTGDAGTNGTNGKDGADGYAPVRGTDYWTAADIAEIKGYVDSAILNGSW